MSISKRHLRAAVGLLVLFTACERAPRTEPAEVTEMRRVAARDACIAQTLLADAEENLATLQAFAGDEADGPITGVSRAALEFARAYHQQAQLRATAFSYADSAANHARSGADSTRYMQRASAFLPRATERGTLDGNVTEAWMRDYSELVADEDHRCHWDV